MLLKLIESGNIIRFFAMVPSFDPLLRMKNLDIGPTVTVLFFAGQTIVFIGLAVTMMGFQISMYEGVEQIQYLSDYNIDILPVSVLWRMFLVFMTGDLGEFQYLVSETFGPSAFTGIMIIIVVLFIAQIYYLNIIITTLGIAYENAMADLA